MLVAVFSILLTLFFVCVGASGIRMVYEGWLQNHGKAGKRQLKDVHLCMAHCLGGKPWNNVSSVIIYGDQIG